MSLSVQFLSLLAMVGAGVVSAAIIDMIGTGISNIGKRSLIRKYAVSLEIVGWLIAGFFSFYILFIFRDGAWRVYDPFAQLSGILLYASHLHKPLRVIGRVVLVILLKPIWFILHILVTIVRKTLQFFVAITKMLIRPFALTFRKLYRNPFKNKQK